MEQIPQSCRGNRWSSAVDWGLCGSGISGTVDWRPWVPGALLPDLDSTSSCFPFLRGCSTSHSYRQWMRVAFFPHLCLYLLLSVIWIITTLVVWSDISLCVCFCFFLCHVAYGANCLTRDQTWAIALITGPPGNFLGGFDLYFPVDWWCWVSFHILMWMNTFLDPFSTFNLVVFLLSSCRLLFFNISLFFL